MPFTILRADLAQLQADAIINAADPRPVVGPGVDEAVHRQAGPQLAEARRRIGDIPPGQLGVTPAFGLRARYVLHTVCPVWQGGTHGEEAALQHCYTLALHTARELGCQSAAFPLLAAGALGFPRSATLNAALRAFREFLADNEMDITLTVYDRASFVLSETLLGTVQSYIDDNYVREHEPSAFCAPSRLRPQQRRGRPSADLLPPFAANAPAERELRRKGISKKSQPNTAPAEKLLRDTAPAADTSFDSALAEDTFCDSALAEDAFFDKSPAEKPLHASAPAPKTAAPSIAAPDWDALLRQTDAGFSETLLQLIDRSGKTDAEIYKKANVDRKLFSKIRSNPDYRPSKPTVLAFAFALELDLDETRDLLERAGFALSHSNRFDLIVEFFLRQGDHDLFALNSVLFHYDLPLLGQ